MIVAANRFKDISILGYIHRVGDGGYDAEEVYIGTLVYRNVFDFTMDNPFRGGISFWDQASEKGGQGVEQNNEYAENIINTPSNTGAIWFRSADVSGHALYINNYHSNGTLIESANQTIPLTIGVPSSEKITPYMNLEIPDYDIPLYPKPSMKIKISEDAYVRGGVYGDDNFNQSSMIVKNASNASYVRKAVLKVDLSEVTYMNIFDEVYLNFYLNSSDSADNSINVYFNDNNAWNQSTVTYNDIMNNELLLVGDVVNLESGTWCKVNVTSIVKEQVAAGHTVITFVLESSDNNYATISSSESSNKPFIKLQ